MFCDHASETHTGTTIFHTRPVPLPKGRGQRFALSSVGLQPIHKMNIGLIQKISRYPTDYFSRIGLTFS